MKSRSYENSTVFWSDIHFEDEECFCGKPYISLIIFTKKFLTNDAFTILISIHDEDDFDIGLKYTSNLQNFANVFGSLLLWMIKKEKEVSNYDDIWNPFEFFPDCNCERILW